MRNALLRPGADPTYADGDDATWSAWTGRRCSVRSRCWAGGSTCSTPAARGAGPPLLFVHGWSSNWQIFLLNIAAFMDTHRVLALDLPGFGELGDAAEPISVQGYAQDGRRVCDALGVERVGVVGNSMGGFVGAELALSFTTRVDRLVLVSAAGLYDRAAGGRAVDWRRRRSAGLPVRAALRVRVRPPAAAAARGDAERVPLPGAAVGPARPGARAQRGQAGLRAGLKALLDYSYRDRLGRSRSRC